MNSQQIKQVFAASGLKVRVADQGFKFRICTVSGDAFDQAAAKSVAASVGLTDVLGTLGGQFNQAHEMNAYKVGAIRRI